MRNVIAAGLFAVATSGAIAQDAPKAQFTVIKGGKDTVAVERFTRDAGTVAGTLTQSNGLKSEYVINLRPDERPEHMEFQRTSPPPQSQTATMSIDFGDTLITAHVEAGPQKADMAFPTQLKPIPFLANSFVLFEQIVRASKPEAGKPVKWMAARLGAGDTATITVSRVSTDTVVVSAANGDFKLAVSKDWNVMGASFAAQQWIVQRSTVKP